MVHVMQLCFDIGRHDVVTLSLLLTHTSARFLSSTVGMKS